jgi:hypothetical protein
MPHPSESFPSIARSRYSQSDQTCIVEVKRHMVQLSFAWNRSFLQGQPGSVRLRPCKQPRVCTSPPPVRSGCSPITDQLPKNQPHSAQQFDKRTRSFVYMVLCNQYRPCAVGTKGVTLGSFLATAYSTEATRAELTTQRTLSAKGLKNSSSQLDGKFDR